MFAHLFKPVPCPTSPPCFGCATHRETNLWAMSGSFCWGPCLLESTGSCPLSLHLDSTWAPPAAQLKSKCKKTPKRLLDRNHTTAFCFYLSTITLKTKVSLSKWASSESPRRKSRKPSIIQEPLVSPGCTLAVTTTAFLVLHSALLTLRDVIVNTYTAFPARLWHRTRTVQ